MTLAIWTIYDHPSDFPAVYVAREWWAENPPRPTGMLLTHAELEPLRDELERMGLTCITRNEGDDPRIVESWL